MTEKRELIRITDLSVSIKKGRGEIPVLKGVSFVICEGERWAIAGESGAGKSMTMHAMTALLPEGSARISGHILFRTDDDEWVDLLDLPYKKRHAFIAERIALIFQDSISVLNPNERIERQWQDTIYLHRPGISKEEAEKHISERMDIFGVPGGKETLGKFPDQLSGGMRQRISIAMALESPARILIADEPTTALDAISQRNTIEFIRELVESRKMTLIFISHNLGILQYICDHAIIMKDGRIVEQGTAEEVFCHAKASYSKQLVEETVKIMGDEQEKKDDKI